MVLIREICSAFIEGLKSGRTRGFHPDKEMRNRLSEKDIDNLIADSFPASDAPATY